MAEEKELELEELEEVDGGIGVFFPSPIEIPNIGKKNACVICGKECKEGFKRTIKGLICKDCLAKYKK